MTNFWDFESRDTYNRRQAEQWAAGARKDAFEMLGQDSAARDGLELPSTMSEDNRFATWQKLKEPDLDAIQPKPAEEDKGGDGLLGIRGAFDSITSPVFGGKLRQPWDLLRPVQRVMEAEQKYIAEPIAKFAYEGISGKDYEDMNPILKGLLETAVSPSTWVGPGLVGKAGKALKIAGVAKYAASESLDEYLARNVIPNIAGALGGGVAQAAGLPGWTGLPVAALSSHGVNMAYGRTGSLGQIKSGDPLSIVIPDEQRVYHGTGKVFDDFSEEHVNNSYGNSFPGSFYVTKDPDIANGYASSSMRRQDSTPNVRPLMVMPKTKLFDPVVDTFYRHDHLGLASDWEEINKLKRDTGLPLSRILELDGHLKNSVLEEKMYRDQGAGGPLFDEWSPENRQDLQKILKSQGYQGINSEHEIILWDKQVLKPLYSIKGKDNSAALVKGFARKNRDIAMAMPGLMEILGNSPGSGRVLGMMASDPDDLDPAVRKAMGWDETAESTGMQAVDNVPAQRGPSAMPSFVADLEPGKSANLAHRTGNLRITAQENGKYTVNEKTRTLMQGDIDHTLKDVSYQDLEIRLSAGKWPHSADLAPQLEANLAEIHKKAGTTPPEPEDPLMQAMRMSIEDLEGAKTAGRILSQDYTDEMRARDAATSDRIANARRAEQGRPPRGVAGGAPESDRMTELLDNVANAPDDLFGVRSRAEAISFMDAMKSQTQRARKNISRFLQDGDTGRKVIDFLAQRGKRIEDTDIIHLINFWANKVQLGPNYGTKVSDELRAIRENGNKSHVLTTEDIKHKPAVPGKPWNPLDSGSTATKVTDQSILDQVENIVIHNPDTRLMEDGVLHLGDLMQYKDLFQLNPQQADLLDSLDSVMRAHRAMEALFEFPADEAPLGYPVHRGLQTSLQPLDDTGLLRESSAGPVVAQRLGAKQGIGQPDSLPSLSAGFASGNKYLPFEEAQSARVSQGYKRMADDWLNRAVEDMGKKAEDFMPAGMQANVDKLKIERGRLSDLRRELARASIRKGTFIPPKWVSDNPAVNNLVADIIVGTGPKTKKAARLAAIADARERVDAFHESADAEFKAAKAEQKSTMESLKSPDSKARGIYTTERNGMYYPSEIADPLNDLNRVEHPDAISRKLNTFNDTVRPIMATLDASFAGVQGLVALFSHPTNFMTAIANLTSAGYDSWFDAKNASGSLDRFIQAGGHLAARNDFAEFLAPSALQRVPGVGNLVKGSNDMFVRFGNVLRAEMFDAALTPEMLGNADSAIKARMDLARTVNLTSGYTPKNPTQIERTLMFAPRFFRSQLGLLSDAVTKGDLSPAGAAGNMSKFLAGGVFTVVALNEALGNETDFDPNSSNFLRVRFGGQDISPFGTWDTLVRAVAKSSDGSEDGLAYLARVKASPAIRNLWDIFQGETLSGQTLDSGSPMDLIASAGKIAAGLGPISGTTLATQPPDFSSPESIASSAIQVFGVKASPLSPSENMAIKREQLAQSQYQKHWEELEPFQKDAIRQHNNIEVESKTEISKAFDYRSAISERYQGRQEAVDSQMPEGPDWIDAYHKIRQEQVGAYEQWAEQNPKALADIRQSHPTTPEQQARQTYYAIFDTASKEHWGPDELSEKLSLFDEHLTQSQRDYIDRNSGLKDTPRVKEYKAAQKVLRPYWDIADQVWDRLSAKLDPSISATSLQDYTTQLTDRLANSGMDARLVSRRVQSDPVIREINRATSTLRLRYRQAHPEADKELVKWYDRKPVR